ncbi:phosphoesterase [Mastigocoleus testarum BC008]|uniref:Phosphoesterase n=1 Tax=Mastigocoleus testarum BC008 TaxID=371196 RepID=A0A0V8A163_9CYAN|nr:phosphoesterase [Mastigocoleus testarum BC008]KST70494.1 phosphoesterase [Mastigocoleus testarum BC008]
MLRKLIDFWFSRVHPHLISLIATVGVTGLATCLLVIYLLAQLSEEVWEKEAFAFDKAILLWIHQYANPTWDSIMLSITKIGDPIILVTVVGVTFITLLWKRYPQEAKIFGFHVLGATVLSYSLKFAFSKQRPQLWEQLITEKSYSYPSGHALGSMVLYGFIAYLLASHYPKFAIIIYSFAVILIGAVGLSRLYLGVHWPTDVFAGYGVGYLWVMFSITVLKLQKLRQPSEI